MNLFELKSPEEIALRIWNNVKRVLVALAYVAAVIAVTDGYSQLPAFTAFLEPVKKLIPYAEIQELIGNDETQQDLIPALVKQIPDFLVDIAQNAVDLLLTGTIGTLTIIYIILYVISAVVLLSGRITAASVSRLRAYILARSGKTVYRTFSLLAEDNFHQTARQVADRLAIRSREDLNGTARFRAAKGADNERLTRAIARHEKEKADAVSSFEISVGYLFWIVVLSLASCTQPNFLFVGIYVALLIAALCFLSTRYFSEKHRFLQDTEDAEKLQYIAMSFLEDASSPIDRSWTEALFREAERYQTSQKPTLLSALGRTFHSPTAITARSAVAEAPGATQNSR